MKIEASTAVDTLGELIEILQDTPDDSLGELPFDPASLCLDLDPFALWKEKDYSRVCLYRDSRVELILLCWSPGAATAVHCHAGSECWMHLCSGRLTESTYTVNDDFVNHSHSRTILNGDRAHINDEIGLHMLANTSSQRAMSLHLYSPAVGACQTFDLLTKKSEWVTLVYDRIVEGAE